MKVFVIAAALLAMVAAQSYPSTGGQQAYGPGQNTAAYSQQVYAPRPYSFAYEVKDPQSYNDFGHQESSDGKTVTGSYRVALPDGRLQLVNYKADDYGYVADVQYQGEAKFPEYRPQQYAAQAGPAYPAPAGLPYPAPAGPAYPAPAGPGPIPPRGPVAVPNQGYAGQGPVRGGFGPANVGAGAQKY